MSRAGRIVRSKRFWAPCLIWFLVCLFGHLVSPAPELRPVHAPVVRLMRASLPMPLKWVAQHYWLAAGEHDRALIRWEVWQDPDWGGTSWGHVHRGLMDWNDPVGGGPTEFVKEWRGAPAKRFLACIEERAPTYEHRSTYRAWPGPNSNTFVEAMLRECDLAWTLDGSAVGKDYRGIIGASLSSGGTGVQLEPPVVGILLGLDEGVQVHALALTFGVDVWPPAILTPLGDGRFGFYE